MCARTHAHKPLRLPLKENTAITFLKASCVRQTKSQIAGIQLHRFNDTHTADCKVLKLPYTRAMYIIKARGPRRVMLSLVTLLHLRVGRSLYQPRAPVKRLVSC